MERINQELIAAKLKLSRATVSRSLANHPSVRPETRDEVLRLAEEMGYQTQPVRAFNRRKSKKHLTVGVLIGVPTANAAMATFPYILKGIRERAEFDRLSLDVVYEPPEMAGTASHTKDILRRIRSEEWRGAILIYPFSTNIVRELAEKISVVSVLQDYPETGLDSIDVDNASGTASLVKLLADRGHRRIGFAAWKYPVMGHWMEQRFSGYVAELFKQGLEFNQNWVLNIHRNAKPLDTPEEIAREAASLMKKERVTAWICAADHQAYHLIQGLRELGLSIPEDGSIAGFDGIEAPLGFPQVTTLKVGHAEIGASALARLSNRILNPKSPRRKILVEASLVEGSTLAPPPA